MRASNFLSVVVIVVGFNFLPEINDSVSCSIWCAIDLDNIHVQCHTRLLVDPCYCGHHLQLLVCRNLREKMCSLTPQSKARLGRGPWSSILGDLCKNRWTRGKNDISWNGPTSHGEKTDINFNRLLLFNSLLMWKGLRWFWWIWI